MPTDDIGTSGRFEPGGSEPDGARRSRRHAHFLGLEGASIVRTPQYAMSCRAIADAVKYRAIASLTGPSGTGKTFALDTIGPQSALPVLRIEFDHRATMRSVTVQLLRALTGEESRGSKHHLIPRLVDALTFPRLILVDEAQRLNRECLDHVRFLHDHRATDFALVFTGGQGCWERLGSEPQLRRRIFRPVHFRPLTERELMKFLPKFHPVWHRVNAEQINTISSRFADGIIGNWAAVTVTLVALLERYVPKGGAIEDALIDSVLLSHGVDPDDLNSTSAA